MSKISIKAIIKQNNKIEEEIETNGILQNKKITYLVKKEDNKIITTIDIKKQIIKRITEEFDLIIDYKNGKIITDYIECQLDLDIKIIERITEQNRIKIKYEVEKEIFEYEIMWRKYEEGFK